MLSLSAYFILQLVTISLTAVTYMLRPHGSGPLISPSTKTIFIYYCHICHEIVKGNGVHPCQCSTLAVSGFDVILYINILMQVSDEHFTIAFPSQLKKLDRATIVGIDFLVFLQTGMETISCQCFASFSYLCVTRPT